MSLRIERGRIFGDANAVFNACLAADLGSALGRAVGPGNVVVSGRDGKGFSRLMKRAMTAGIMENGIQVLDTRLVPAPVLRYCLRFTSSDFGVYVGFYWKSPTDLSVTLYDDRGAILPPQDVESIKGGMGKEERVVPAREVGDIIFFAEALSTYKSEVVRSVAAGYEGGEKKILIDCANGAVSTTLPRMLRDLGCEVVTINSNPTNHLTSKPCISDDALMFNLGRMVVERGADLGIALDPCGESMRILDDQGDILTQEELALLFIEYAGARRVAVDANLAASERLAASGARIVPLSEEAYRIMPEEIDLALGMDDACYLRDEVRRWWDSSPVTLRILEMVSEEGKLSKLRQALA